MAKKSVVVLGAGFGGLRTAMDVAKGLQRMKLLGSYEVVLVDRNDCHLFIPLLYRVAASPDTRHETNCSYEITMLLAGLPIRFVNAEIASLDLTKGVVHLANSTDLHGEYLVIALGAETNYFGIPGLQENALQLKTLETAMKIREEVSRAFTKGGNVSIIAGGAGPNGIELAAEIRAWADQAERQNKNLHVSVSIIEASPGILGGLDPRVADIAAKRLKKLGVSVETHEKILSVARNEITAGGDANNIKIPFDVFIWTGGVKTPDMLTQLPVTKDPHGRPLTENDMKLGPTVYGLGDSICFMNPKTGKSVPAIAHAAILEGIVTAHNILEEIKRTEFSSYTLLPATYRPSEYPYVIPVGEHWSVAKVGPFVFSGWLGWAFGRLVELNYLMTIMPFGRAWTAWQNM